MALSITITPGKRFQLAEVASSAKLNQLGQPTASLTGTVAPEDMSGADYSSILAPGAYFYGVDSGVPNGAIVTVPFPLTGYSDGLVLAFRCMNQNTGASTLQIITTQGIGGAVLNTFAAAPVVKQQPGIPLAAGDWVPGQIVECRYRLDGDLIQSQDYSNTGSLVIPVIPGFSYAWTKGANDTSLTYTVAAGAVVLNASGSFTPTTASVTLAGTVNLPSGGTLIANSNYWQMMGATPLPPSLTLMQALKFR